MLNNVRHAMPRDAAVGLRVDPKVKAAAEKAAADDRRSLSSLIEKALVEYLVRNKYLKPGAA
jgi:hypothetical protein